MRHERRCSAASRLRPLAGVARARNRGAWLLGLLWILPLAYAVWTAFHPAEYATRFALVAPLTLENFVNAWHAAPFARYFLNTFAAGDDDPGGASSCSARSPPMRSRASSSAAATSCSRWCCCS